MSIMLRVRTTWGGVGGGALSTHYFGDWPGAGTPAEIQACVDRVRDFWVAVQNVVQATASYTVNGQVDLINSENGELTGSLAATSRSGAGFGTGDVLPAQTQGLIAWSTAAIVDGHRLRGQTFIPAPNEGNNTAGAPTSVYVTALNAAVSAILATGTFTLRVWHRPLFDSSGTLIRTGSASAVTAGSGRGAWAVLRSRR